MVLGVVFAQFITVAHACARIGASPQTATTLAVSAGETMPSDCHARAKRAVMNTNVCDSHCAYGQQIDVQPDAPIAAIAPQTALTVNAVSSAVQPFLDTMFLHARTTAPPLSLLFGRFLI